MSYEIVILAVIAAFLGMRLYAVLGKRTGHEQEPMRRSAEPGDAPQPGPVSQKDEIPHGNVHSIDPRQGHAQFYDVAAEPGIRQLMNADRGFDVTQFVENAKTAYGMILEAFWKGEREELKSLCDADVYADFEAALNAREEAGESLDNRLVRIEKAMIADVEYDAPIARVTMSFDADIAAVTRNKEGDVVAGSLSDAVETHDIWTFERDVNSVDPHWLLVETDEAS